MMLVLSRGWEVSTVVLKVLLLNEVSNSILFLTLSCLSHLKYTQKFLNEFGKILTIK